MPNEDKVLIFDTTLRDGEQSAGLGLTADDKIQIAQQLDKLRVDIIEAGFAAASPGDLEAVRRIAREVRRPIICSLSRPNASDVDAAWEALRVAEHPRIHVFLSTSEVHLMHMLRKNREDVLEMAVQGVQRAKRYCDDVEFSAQDATRTQPEYLYQLIEAVIEAGATTINIADTVGYMIPAEFAELVASVQRNVRNMDKARISVHCHNDLGLAVSNSLAAVKVGARQVEACINGIGERAGNASEEEIIMGLKTRRDYFGLDMNVDTTQIWPTSRLLTRISGFPMSPGKAIVGDNAFRHASGIHQDGVLKLRQNYEIMDPKDVGWRGGASLVLGKLSGRAGLRSRLADLGYKLEGDALNRVFQAFKELADKKHEVTDRDLESLMMDQEQVAKGTVAGYTLQAVEVQTGSGKTPTATVRVVGPDGKVIAQSAQGNGPVDAACNAITQAVGVQTKLVEFVVQSITEGLDSIGEVTMRLERDGKVYTGRGSSTDIIEASAKAFLAAINRSLTAQDAPAVAKANA